MQGRITGVDEAYRLNVIRADSWCHLNNVRLTCEHANKSNTSVTPFEDQS